MKYETDFQESKKLKELGYDFYLPKIEHGEPLKFSVGQKIPIPDKVFGLSGKLFQVHGLHLDTIEYKEETHYVYSTSRFIGTGTDFITTKKPLYLRINDVYPIVSYYVLQQCLPKFQDNWNFYYNFLGTYLTIEGAELHIDQEFDNPYEAFIWCHENYPEELRERFAEVMNEYRI
jgi:hypothetical protein